MEVDVNLLKDIQGTLYEVKRQQKESIEALKENREEMQNVRVKLEANTEISEKLFRMYQDLPEGLDGMQRACKGHEGRVQLGKRLDKLEEDEKEKKKWKLQKFGWVGGWVAAFITAVIANWDKLFLGR